MTTKRWLIAAAITCIAATGCSRTDAEAPSNTRRPQQAGATNPLVTASHLAGVEVAGLTGDQRAMQGHVDAMHKDMMRSMHLPDPSRPINHEAARTDIRPLQGDDLGRRGYVVAELPARGERAGDVAVEAAGGCVASGGEAGISGAAGWE